MVFTSGVWRLALVIGLNEGGAGHFDGLIGLEERSESWDVTSADDFLIRILARLVFLSGFKSLIFCHAFDRDIQIISV